MKIHKQIAIICAAVMFLHGCSKEQGNAEKNGVTPQVTGKNAATPKESEPKSQNGAYELAEVLAWAMPNVDLKNPTSLPSNQNYNRFKGVINEIHATTSNLGGYEGTVQILAEGKRTIIENIEDNYKWQASITGPQVGANSLILSSQRAVGTDVGPTYLRKHDFDLMLLSCFSDGDTPTNATALYLARFPGKAPVLLGYSVSTGSAGQFIAYQVYFGPIAWESVPGARQLNYKGESQPFGSCPYKALI